MFFLCRLFKVCWFSLACQRIAVFVVDTGAPPPSQRKGPGNEVGFEHLLLVTFEKLLTITEYLILLFLGHRSLIKMFVVYAFAYRRENQPQQFSNRTHINPYSLPLQELDSVKSKSRISVLRNSLSQSQFVMSTSSSHEKQAPALKRVKI